MKTIRVLACGAGVQTVALAHMAIRGVIAPFDIVIFADTRWERQATYDYIRDHLRPALENAGVPFVVVAAEQKFGDVDQWGGVFVPAYTKRVVYADQLAAWSRMWAEERGLDVIEIADAGVLRRQCTQRWKIRPIRRWLRQHMRSVGAQRVRLALGISHDEALRRKPSNVRWVENIFPLLDEVHPPWTRADCERFLREHDIPIPPRSACVFCPYQESARWMSLSETDRAAAVQVDEALRFRRIHQGVTCYVHRSRKPLREVLVQLDSSDESSWIEECEGMCGI